MKRQSSVLALNLCRIKGIPIRIHITFFLLLGWIAFEQIEAGQPPLNEVLFILALFGCVLLHELGHALTARRFKISTKDIMLYPFGGVASLMGTAKPGAELLIAIAGPAVNVALALIIWPFLGIGPGHENEILVRSDILARLFSANIMLVIFNMIPAFPMDGGRVLRAALALLKVKRATLIAARISQFLCLVIGALALYAGNPILVLIAAVVFMGALQETMHERAHAFAGGHTASDIMTKASQLQALAHGNTVGQALETVLPSSQSWFPVTLGERLIGLVERDALLQAAALDPDEQYVSGLMERELDLVNLDTPLESVLEKMEQHPNMPLVVMQAENFVGLIIRERLLEFLMVHGLRRERTGADLYPPPVKMP